MRLVALPALLFLFASAANAQSQPVPVNPNSNQPSQIDSPASTQPQTGTTSGSDNLPSISEPSITQIGTGASRNKTRSGRFRITPGITVGLSASDNIDTVDEGTPETGGLLEIAPTVEFSLRRPNSYIDFSAGLTSQKYFNSQFLSDRTDPQLSGSADFSIDEELRLRAEGNVFRVSRSGTGLVTTEPDSSDLFRQFLVSPYLSGQLSEHTMYELGYEFQVIDRGQRSDINRFFGELSERSIADSDFGLLVRTDGSQVVYKDGLEYRNVRGLMALDYTFGSRYRFGLGAYYSSIDAFEFDGDTKGVGGAAYWDWRPNPRSAFQGLFAQAYYGDVISVRFRRLFTRWLFGATYNKDIIDGNVASTILFRPITLTRDQRALGASAELAAFQDSLRDRDIDFGPGQELFTTSSDSALVSDETYSLTAAFSNARNSAVFSLFHVDRERAAGAFSGGIGSLARQAGVYLLYDRQMTPRMSFRLTGQYRHTELDAALGDTDSYTADVSLRYRLGRRSNLTFVLRNNTQEGTGEAISYKENSLGLVFSYKLL